MQGATFVLHIPDSMPMVAVTARCAVIVRFGHGGLAFEHMHGMVKHQRHDSGNLGDQE